MNTSPVEFANLLQIPVSTVTHLATFKFFGSNLSSDTMDFKLEGILSCIRLPDACAGIITPSLLSQFSLTHALPCTRTPAAPL
jgi:hypothetical protein